MSAPVAGLGARRGYDRLGHFMGRVPGLAIFRSFSALAAEDLLYRQAELFHLEEKLRLHQKNDAGDHVRNVYCRFWPSLEDSHGPDADEGDDGSQLLTILEIREKLMQYHEALIRRRKVLDLEKPSKYNVEDLRLWMETPARGNVHIMSHDGDTWSDQKYFNELVQVVPPQRGSYFDENLMARLQRLYHHLIGRRIHNMRKPKDPEIELGRTGSADLAPNTPGSDGNEDVMRNTVHYKGKRLFKILTTLTTAVACLLPILSIVILNLTPDIPKRLGIIAVCVALFSGSLSVMSDAQVKDIFTATSTFAAVLVVFAGTGDCQCAAPAG